MWSEYGGDLYFKVMVLSCAFLLKSNSHIFCILLYETTKNYHR